MAATSSALLGGNLTTLVHDNTACKRETARGLLACDALFSLLGSVAGAGVKRADKTHKERVLEFILLPIYIFASQRECNKGRRRQAIMRDCS